MYFLRKFHTPGCERSHRSWNYFAQWYPVQFSTHLQLFQKGTYLVKRAIGCDPCQPFKTRIVLWQTSIPEWIRWALSQLEDDLQPDWWLAIHQSQYLPSGKSRGRLRQRLGSVEESKINGAGYEESLWVSTSWTIVNWAIGLYQLKYWYWLNNM